MRNGPALGISGRYAQLEPAVTRTFDIPFMTQLAVGSVWSRLTDLQRQQVTQAFGRYVAAIYADRFNSYSGQRMEVLTEQPSANGTRVNSKIVKADGQPVGIGYLVRENAGVWRVVDVYFEGTISEMATRRSEFATILRTTGIEGLIQVLNRKADELGAPNLP
jgi:phospholipid transport system substrate-binding protein